MPHKPPLLICLFLLILSGLLVTCTPSSVSTTSPLSTTSATAVQAESTPGVIPGSFSVSQNGDAQYNIPIDVPPGIGDAEPGLSFAYSSNQPNGRLGVGWRLNGLSSIARCKAVPIYDNYYGSINYNSADRYCLDSQRLINISGAYGAASSSYKTSIETWRTIQASSDQCGSGPCSFTVTNSNGSVFTYGTSADSRILATGRLDVRVWALKQVQDLNGNVITFNYTTDPLSSSNTGQYYITRIDYTANTSAAIASNRSVQFFYQSRPDVEENYQGGKGITTKYLLSHVQTFLGTQPVFDYKLSYATSKASGRSELQNIQLCSTASCLTPTSFAWQGSGLIQYSKKNLSTNMAMTSGQQILPADVNNDGRGDLIVINPGGTNKNPLVNIYQSTGSDFKKCTNQSSLNNSSTTIQIGDFNGDGRLDILQFVTNGTQQTMLYLGKTDGCTFQSTNTFNTGITATATNIWAMDFNGDGRTDFVEASLSNQAYTITSFKSTGTSFAKTSSRTISTSGGQLSFQPMDVNGDGMVDLVGILPNSAGTTYKLTSYISNGTNFNTEVTSSLSGNSGATFLPMDINGDGNVDLVKTSSQSNALQLTPVISNGIGGFTVGTSINQGFTGTLAVWPMDANGDGKTDLVQAYEPSNGQLRLALYLNSDGSFDQGSDLGVQLSANDFNTTYPMDLSGDGRMLVLQGYINGANLYFSTYGTAQASLDRINAITDGMGNKTTATYLPMSDPDVYLSAATNPTYPVLPVLGYSYRQSPGQYPYQAVSGGILQLVSSYTNQNTASASAAPYSYNYTMSYSGASMGLDGTGWLGFKSVTRVNKQTGAVRVDNYNQPYPLTGNIASTQYFCTVDGITSPDPLCPKNTGNTIISGSSTKYQQVVTATGSTAPYPPVYLLQKPSTQIDAYTYGTYNNSRSETYQYDAYGQVTLLSNLGYVNPDGTDISASDNVYTCTNYYPFSGLPLLDYPVNIKIASTSSCTNWDVFNNSTDLSMEKVTYTPQMQISSKSSWDSSNNVYLVTTLSYDTLGNLAEYTQPTGTTSYSYDPTYHTFVASISSPPNANGTRQVSHFAFDPRFGTMVGYADPNNLVSTTCIDDFGRTTATQSPPPNFVTVPTNASCVSMFTASSSLFDNPSLVTVETQSLESNSTGLYLNVSQLQDWSAWSTATTREFWHYYDGLGRNFQSVAQGTAATGNTATCNVFDAENNITAQTIPYYIPGEENASCQISDVNTDTRHWLSFNYDVYNRPTKSVIPMGPNGNEQSITTLSYPNAANSITDTTILTLAAGDPYAIQKTFDYQFFNSVRHLTKMSVPDSTGAISNFNYDVLGRMVTATDPPTASNPQGVANTISYDSLNRRLTLNNPDQNTTGSGQASRWSYSPSTGLLNSVTDAKGQVISYSYDQLSRILTKNLSNQYLLSFTYDNPAVAYSMGKLTSLTKTDSATNAALFNYNYTFDTEDNQLTETLNLTGYGSYTTGTEFDPLNRLTKLTYPDQTILQHSYQMGNLTSSTLQGVPYATYTNYTALGSAQNVTYGNNVTSSYSFDPAGLTINSIIKNPQQQPLLNQTVAWNHLFEVTAINDNLKNQVDYSQSFTHNLQRLTGARADGLYGSLAFSYDASGNLISQNGVTNSYSAHRLITSTLSDETSSSIQYDQNGNTHIKQNAEGQWQYTYDPLNSMLSATLDGSTMLSTPVIDEDGQRLVKIDNQAIASIYASSQYVVTNYPDSASVATRYLSSGDGEVLGMVTATLQGTPPANPGSGYPTPGTLYFASDYLNTTQLTTGSDGNIVSRFAYKPYGGMIQTGTTGPDNIRQKFQAKELDSSTGLYNFDVRYQDPEASRFTSPDTEMASDLQRIDAMNRFAFALNDPVTNRDINGHSINNRVLGGVIGGLEIATGIAIDVASVGTLTPVSAVLIGAGTSAVMYSSQEHKHFSWNQYGVQSGIGGAMGLVTPGFGGGALEEGVGRVAIEEGESASVSGARGVSAAETSAGRDAGEIEMKQVNNEKNTLENDNFESCSSFTAGTEVLTSNGKKPIENVAVGELVFAYNEQTGKNTLYPVTHLVTRIVPEEIIISAGKENINTTAEHLFYVNIDDSTSTSGKWIKARDIRAGNGLRQFNGNYLTVKSIKIRSAPVRVYNFEIAEVHNYYVSDENILVHNVNCSNKIARERYKKGGGYKAKGVSFKEWKKGREAQHLIAYSEGRKAGLPDSFLNSGENGMMIPSGRDGAADMPNPALAKGKITHIKSGNMTHPEYNKFVGRVLAKQRGKWTNKKMFNVSQYLRNLHKQGIPKGVRYVDDLNTISDSAIPVFR